MKPAPLQWKSYYAPGEPLPAMGASPIPFTAGPPMRDHVDGGNYDEHDGTHDEESEERVRAWLSDARATLVAPDLMATIKAELGR